MYLLQGHTGPVRCVAYSADGRILASGGDDNTVQVRELVASPTARVLTRHKDAVRALAFSPNGQKLLSGGWDNQTVLASLRRPQQRLALDWAVPASGGVWSVAISPDGRSSVCGFTSGTVSLRHSKKKWLNLLHHTWPVSAVAFNPDGWTFASASHDRRICLWDANYGRPRATLVGYRDWVRTLAYSADGQLLASGCEDGTVKLWDVSGVEREPNMPAPVTEVAEWEGHAGRICQVAFLPDNRTLLSVGWDATIRFWDVASGRQRSAFNFGIGRVHCAAVAPDGMTAAAGGDGVIVVWDLEG